MCVNRVSGCPLESNTCEVCLPVITHLDHGITQICIIVWPDVSVIYLSVAGDPPLDDSFIICSSQRVHLALHTYMSQHMKKVDT